MEVFPRLELNSLFLASPGDVTHLRRMAQEVFRDMVAYGGRKLDYHVFAWETADLEENDARPIQRRIKRPDDPKSLGLAAFFGERIGQPLAPDFPTDMLDNLPCLFEGGLYEGRRYRLVHPWEEGAEEEGGFPLTGSTFEVLCALAGQRRLDSIGSDKTIPSFICFASPPEVLGNDDASAAPWGNDALLDEIAKKYKGREQHREFDKVYVQRDQLRNFARYLKSIEIEMRFIADNSDILEAYKKFLNKNFITVSDPTDINPFLGLKSYDVRDAPAYFGRDPEVETALKVVEAAFADEAAPNFYWVKGSSGVGKSSFLRAGLIGKLVTSPLKSGNYAYLVFRPNQLLSDGAAEERRREPLYVLFEAALKALRLEFPDTAPDDARLDELLDTFGRLPREERGEWSLSILDRCVAQTDRGNGALPSRLLIGVDQFEEIVDMVHDPNYSERWASFLDFITRAHTASRLFVAATLRQRRLEKMRDHDKLGALWHATSNHVNDLDFPSPTALESIIRYPFELIGKSFLAGDVVQALQDEIRAYRGSLSGKQAGSLMPLVSLVLERLHLEVGEPKRREKLGKKDAGARDGESSDANDPSDAFNPAASEEFDAGPVEITLKEARGLIKLDGMIAELARRAMQEAEITNAVEESDSTLDDLLRKLVRWTGSEAEDDTQFYLPAIDMPTEEAEAKLARALLRNRILMDEGHGKVKLVHETVTRNWPEARAFFERERPLYRSEYLMKEFARDWKASGETEIKPFQVSEYCDAACDMLGLWTPRFSSYFNKNIDPKDQLLRDYCLGLMKEVCDPRRVVERTPKKSHHLYLATLYERLDIVDAMLTRDQEAANHPRADKRTAIFPLCFTNNLEILDRLIEAGADVNAEEEEGWKPIQVAAIGGSIAFVERLLENGATLETKRVHPLHWAARYDHADLVTHLLQTHRTDPDTRDSVGWTPAMFASVGDAPNALRALAATADLEAPIKLDEDLPSLFGPIHVAAANGKLNALKALIELGVPVDLKDGAGGTALHYAAKEGHTAVVSYLAELMSKNTPDGADPRMIHAWSQTEIATARKELEKDKPADAQLKLAEWTPLHIAVSNGHQKCVQALVQAGADPDRENRAGITPMNMAIVEQKSDVVMWLANHCDLRKRDKDGRTPLQVALKREDMPLAVELAARDPERKSDYLHDDGMTDAYRITALHRAVAGSNEQLTKFLLLGRSSGDLSDVFGRTPLHVAAVNGQAEQIRLLLRNDASDLLARDAEGMVPLDLAASAGRYRAAEALIKEASHLDLPAKAPNALHHAARGGNRQIVEALIAAGYSPDGANENGVTPLMVAVCQDNADVVEHLLLDERVMPQRPITGRDEVTAITLAIETGATESLRLLLKRIGPSSLPVRDLVWRATEVLQFYSAATLLEAAGERDFKHPETRMALSSFYRETCEAHARVLPHDKIHSARLEALLFPERAKKVSEKPGADGRDSPAPKVMDAAPKELRPGGSVMTQSRANGYASDLYPIFDKDRTFWHEVRGDDRKTFIEQITPVDGKYRINPETARIHRRSLPWYDNVELIHVMDPTSFAKSNLALCYLTDQGNLFRLNGTSPPIHEVNAKAPIRLTEDNVADYIRFFCFFVRGEEGPFYITESAADPLVPQSDETVRNIIEGTARPVTFEGMNDQGHFLLSVVVFYSNAIFIADFAVHPTGMIEMLDDEPIAADLPIKIDCPLA